MKKNFTVFIALLLSTHLIAQTPATSFKRFGVKAGAVLSNFNFNKGQPPPPEKIANSWKPGLAAGFILRIPLATKLMIVPEYMFSAVGGEDKSTGTNYAFDYLSMPVSLRYQLNSKLALTTGPEFDLLISASKKLNGSSSSITHDVEERNLGITAGFEVKIIKELWLNGRYLLGLSHIGLRNGSAPLKEFKMQQLQLTFSVDL